MNYSQATDTILKGTTFHNSGYLGTQSKAAYYLILLGSICTALALFTSVMIHFIPVCILKLTKSFVSGVIKRTVAFFVSSSLAVLGSFLLLVGAALWTVIIKKTEAVNDKTVTLGQSAIPIIMVSAGPGLFLTWAAFACLAVSIVPYMLRYVAFDHMPLHFVVLIIENTQLLYIPRIMLGRRRYPHTALFILHPRPRRRDKVARQPILTNDHQIWTLRLPRCDTYLLDIKQ
jgi:hypothetical protein